MLNMVD